MSTNDDSASRRGRRTDQGEPDWRTNNRQRPGERWDQPSSGNRDGGANPYNDQRTGRDNPPQNAAYSGFTRPAYPPQRQEPPVPPAPPQTRPYEPSQSPQGFYPEPPRQEPPRTYAEPAVPTYTPPPPAYHAEPQNSPYGDAGRDDLFGRDQAPAAYGQNPYGSQTGYQPEPYNSAPPRAPLSQPAAPREPEFYNRQPSSSPEDYERGFGAKVAAQDNGSSRFFLPEEQQPQAAQQWQQQNYAPPPPQAPVDRGYPSSQPYQGGYEPKADPAGSFGHDQFDPRFAGQESWHADEQGFDGGGADGSHGRPALHGDELDEDFFGDDDEFEDDHGGERKGGRKKLLAAALVAALAAGGGAYYYKTMSGGGDKATPFIRADTRPAKETPGSPGGRQFPNGEKAIYEQLTPDGQTQIASFSAPPAPVMQASTPAVGAAPGGGSSLDDRIEEALKRAHQTGDAPAAAPAPGGQGLDQPTVVRSESYRPDGTRVDTRPIIQPQFANVNAGQLPPPFGNAAPVTPAAAVPPSAPPRAAPQPQFATAMAASPRSAAIRAAPPPPAELVATAPAGGFYVSLKSAPDEKAIQRDIPTLTDKYKSVLGNVQLVTKIADLGAKGVTYRAVAGPLGSRQEALDLCQKIKGVGGDKACFVTN